MTDHIREKLGQSPHKPGVYLMKDRLGTVIYVGKARDLRKRLSQYFQSSRQMRWDVKFNALVEAIHDFDVHVVRSEPEALLLEGKLIKQFLPRYNISFRDDKQFLMLKVNLNDPIPRFSLTRMKQNDGARYFGPFANSGAIRRTLHLVRRQFNLRGCRPLTPTDADYKHCLYGNLKFCTAPCIGNVTREQYCHQVSAACDFLSGQCHEMADQLEAEMKKAAAGRDYERAAQLRDTIADLRRATKKNRDFVRVPYNLPLALDPERDLQDLARALGLPAAPLRIEGFDISNISGTFAVASLVSFWRGRPERVHYRRFKMKSVVGQDDFACMAEAVRRRYTRLLREAQAGGAPRDDEEESKGVVEEMQVAIRETSARVRRSRAPQRARGTQASEDPAAPQADAPEDTYAEAIEDSSATSRSASARSNLPDLILIDGGKGQLNAAVAELKRAWRKSPRFPASGSRRPRK
ncbi:MAG: GIY-YIG nuclease family protein [Verrucomicrobia bacterium]|nr:GIY-YIG nuclease family protein [Verrucomicrobiota bacterium]